MVVPLLLATGRVGALGAGLAGIAAAIGAVLLMNDGSDATAILDHAVFIRLWLTLQAVLFIFSGLFSDRA